MIGLFTLNRLLEGLDGFVVARHTPVPVSTPFHSCHMLDGTSIADHRILHMGTPDMFVQAADQMSCPSGCTFVTAGNSPALVLYLDREDINLIVTALTLPALCNTVLRLISKADQWTRCMNQHMYVDGNLSDLITCGAKHLKGDAYLLDTGYKLLCTNPEHSVSHPVLQELSEKEYLPHAMVQSLRTLLRDREGEDTNPWVCVEEGGGRFLLRQYAIQYKTNVVGYFLMAVPEESFTPATQETAQDFFMWVERFLLKFRREKYETNNALNTLLGDLIEGRLEESEELISRLKQLPVAIKKYYHCIVVEFANYLPPDRIAHLMFQLEQIFPQSTITPYKGDIIILAWKRKHYSGIFFDEQALNAFLLAHNAVACVGNFTRWLSSLPPIYRQTKGVIEYAKMFRPDPDVRLFRFEEYSMYQIVGLCAQHAREFFSGDLVYLSHPGIITLATYDQKHNTNLCEILNIYLMNDRNLTQTAKILYFHRNTLQHKIDKIQQILDEDLDNAMIRQRLLFSCRVLEYIQKYLEMRDVYGKRRFFPSTSELVVERAPSAAAETGEVTPQE